MRWGLSPVIPSTDSSPSLQGLPREKHDPPLRFWVPVTLRLITWELLLSYYPWFFRDCVFVFSCVSTCLCVCVCMYMCRIEHNLSCHPNVCHPLPLGNSLSSTMTLQLGYTSRDTLPPELWDYEHTPPHLDSGDWVWVFKLARQTFYQLSHLQRLRILFLEF